MSEDNRDANLRHQFQQLQKQQQRRLEERSAKISKQNSSDSCSHNEAWFGVADDMDLKTLQTREATAAAATYHQETDQLHEQIRELKDENGRLFKLLSEREFDLRRVRKKLQDSEMVQAAGAGGNAPAATKIVELSKQVRELTAELESEKTKTKQLERKCLQAEKQLSELPCSAVDDSKGNSLNNEMASGSTDEMKRLQEKLRQAELKSSEHRNQVQTLKNELKMMQKVLAQEVGENVQAQTLLNSSSGWRGRAQQIAALQLKVNELKKQLEQTNQQGDGMTLEDVTSDQGDFTFRLGYTAGASSDNKQKEKIRQIERQRREANDKLAADLKLVEQENESLKQKVEASKARITTLMTENKTVKQQLQTMLDKDHHDNELIESLLKKQSQLQQAVDKSTKKSDDAEQAKKSLETRQQQDSNVLEQLKAIVAEKEAKIKNLEVEVFQLRTVASVEHSQRCGAVVAMEHGQSRPSSGRVRQSPIDNVHPDIAARIIEDSLSPTPSQNVNRMYSRPQSRVAANVNSASQSSANGHISHHVPAGETSQEMQLKCHELNTLYQALSVERDRLSELVKVLEKRVQEGTFKVAETTSELQTQRRHNALLEKQLGKAKVDQTTSGKKPRSKTSSSAIVADEDVSNVDELKTKLDIQRDENEALKVALQTTLTAKEDDIRMCMDMMEEAKKAFIQGIQHVRRNSPQD